MTRSVTAGYQNTLEYFGGGLDPFNDALGSGPRTLGGRAGKPVQKSPGVPWGFNTALAPDFRTLGVGRVPWGFGVTRGDKG